MFPTSTKNSNTSQKRQSVKLESKKDNEMTFQQLYLSLCKSISEQKLQELQEILKKLNQDIFVSFDKIDIILQKREDLSVKVNEKIKSGMNQVIGKVQESMTEVLQTTMQEGEENLENWKLLNEKKVNYEKMHQNLLEIKRKSLDFGFMKRSSK